jgi:hypothetical protein
MRRRLWLAAASLLLAQCAAQPPAPGTFSFAVLGDTPYNEREEAKFVEMMDAMNREALAFAVHVGDFKAGHDSPCTDELFERRKAQFDRFAHAFVLTPGDNDWADCGRPSNGGADPLERLDRLRAIFFGDRHSLGVRRIETEAQPGHPENRRWEHGGIVFATINMQGGNDRAAASRRGAALEWLAQAAERAAGAAALVVLTQVNPFDKRPEAYAAHRDALVRAARGLGKPVLFVHGDTHQYRADTPFRDASGAALSNPARLEVHGSPFVGWVKVSVDASRAGVFSFEPHRVAFVPP